MNKLGQKPDSINEAFAANNNQFGEGYVAFKPNPDIQRFKNNNKCPSAHFTRTYVRDGAPRYEIVD